MVCVSTHTFAVGGITVMALPLAWIAFYYFLRNWWVFTTRMAVLAANLAVYERLPSYSTMMRKVWIWDVRDFLRDRAK
jgi:hypothetical protein